MVYKKSDIIRYRNQQTTLFVLCLGIPLVIYWIAQSSSVEPTGIEMYRQALFELTQLASEKQAGPIFIRLAWHDAGTYDASDGTGGPRGSIRLQPQSGYTANNGLDVARQLLQPLKLKYHEISHADWYALAGVAGVHALHGPVIGFRSGRIDADATVDMHVNLDRLPRSDDDAPSLLAMARRLSMSPREFVALCGAHTVGRAHIGRSGHDGAWTTDDLRFNNEYFRNLLNNQWTLTPATNNRKEQYEDEYGHMMLPSDMALLRDNEFRQYVELYANDQSVWFQDFALAFQKLLELGWENSLGPRIN